MLDLDIIFCS